MVDLCDELDMHVNRDEAVIKLVKLSGKYMGCNQTLDVKYLTHVLSYYDDLPPHDEQTTDNTTVLNELAMCHRSHSEHQRCKFCAQCTFKIVKTQLDDDEAASIAGEKEAEVHIQLGKLKVLADEKLEAIHHYSKAVDIYGTCFSHNNYGENLNIIISLLGQIGDLYDELESGVQKDEAAAKLRVRADKHYAEILTIRSRSSYWGSVTSKEMSKAFMRYTTLSHEYQFHNKWFERALEIYKEMEQPNCSSKVVQLLTDMANYYLSDNKQMSMQCITDAFEMHRAQNETTLDDTANDLLDNLFRIFTQNHEDEKADCYISIYLQSSERKTHEIDDGSIERIIIANIWMRFASKWRERRMYSKAAKYLFEAVTLLITECPEQDCENDLMEAAVQLELLGDEQLELLGDELETGTNYQEPKEIYIKALTARKNVTGGDHESTNRLLHKIGTMCNQLLWVEEAQSYFSKMSRE